jgi:exonuclease VII small subunit
MPAHEDSIVLAFPQQDPARLRLALRRLEGALAEQAAAMAMFRASVAELRESVHRLETGVDGFRGGLDDAALRCAEASSAAQAAVRQAALFEAATQGASQPSR